MAHDMAVVPLDHQRCLSLDLGDFLLNFHPDPGKGLHRDEAAASESPCRYAAG